MNHDAIRAQAAALAGRLAELGEQRVVFDWGAGRRELLVRQTDLPGEIMKLVESGGGTIIGVLTRVHVCADAQGLLEVTPPRQAG